MVAVMVGRLDEVEEEVVTLATEHQLRDQDHPARAMVTCGAGPFPWFRRRDGAHVGRERARAVYQ